jgi:hypothetical protein
MSNAQRRIPEKTRVYEGEDDADFFVNWLNGTKDSAAKDRIIDIVGRVELLENYEKAKWRKYPVTAGKDYIALTSKQRDRVAREVDKALSYYRMRPRISVYSQENYGPITSIGWRPISGSKLDRHDRAAHVVSESAHKVEDDPRPGARMLESAAMRMALEFMQSGAIRRIVPCRCGNFFYLRFSHQKFCSTKCRLAEFRNSDEARKKRNDYARKLYHLHKKLDSGKVR